MFEAKVPRQPSAFPPSQLKALRCIASKCNALQSNIIYCNSCFRWKAIHLKLALLWQYNIHHSNIIQNPISADEYNTGELNPFLQGLCCSKGRVTSGNALCWDANRFRLNWNTVISYGSQKQGGGWREKGILSRRKNKGGYLGRHSSRSLLSLMCVAVASRPVQPSLFYQWPIKKNLLHPWWCDCSTMLSI